MRPIDGTLCFLFLSEKTIGYKSSMKTSRNNDSMKEDSTHQPNTPKA